MTSNLAFSRWGETLGDAATIDRLVHHAQVIASDATTRPASERSPIFSYLATWNDS